MNGETIETASVETENGVFQLTIRFVDWAMPDHRDTRGLAIPKYTVQIEAPSGDSKTFDYWGSVHAAEEQDPELGIDVLEAAENVVRDAEMFFNELDGTHQDLDRQMTASALQNDLAPMVDRLAETMDIDDPSEAIRAFGEYMKTARKFRDLELSYLDITELSAEIRDELGW